MLFRIKICGITTPEDAAMVAAAGADAVGFNFFAGSKRYVSPTDAVRAARELPRQVVRVGVFVDMDIASIRRIARQVELDFVQLHGAEPPEFLTQLDGLQVVKAFRCQAGLEPVREYLSQCSKKPVAVLLDAYDPQQFGGTGKTLEWSTLGAAGEILGGLPLILAGGLTPDNVGMAISSVRPAAVDTASGVENATPGRKDSELTKAFVLAAKSAFTA